MDHRPYTILIVSPDRQTLRRLTKFLEVFGYEVLQAIDSQSAISAAHAVAPNYLIVDNSAGPSVDIQLAAAVTRIWPQSIVYRLLLSERLEVGDVTAAMEAGFDDFLAAPIVFGELLARLRAGARLLEYERRLNEQSGIDPVTGLAEKAALATELQRRSQTAKGKIGWLGLFELDYFERFVSRFGRDAAKNALHRVGQLLQSRLDECHLGGALASNRLAVLLPSSGAEAATAWCDEFVQLLADMRFETAGQDKLSASCGLTEVVAGEELDAILGRCEKALGLARASGRGCTIATSEVERDAEEWTAFAADGKLFETTLARDVMHPCPLLLHLDEGIEQAHALLSQTGLAQAPVVDAAGKLAGLVSLEQLAAARPRQSKSRQVASNSSVRLVRHVVTSEVVRFEEETTLGELLEFFTGEDATLAIVIRNQEPRGLIHCQALAALNERLSPEQFAAAQPRTGTSADLLVPDLALAD